MPPGDDPDDAAIGRALAVLTEHFQTVVILVSRVEDGPDGRTHSWSEWRGNWHACLGHAREWVAGKTAEARARPRRRFDEQDDGD